MPVFWFDKVLGVARSARAFLKTEGDATPSVTRGPEQREEGVSKRRRARRPESERKKELKSVRQELDRERQELRRELCKTKNDIHATKDYAERIEHYKRQKRIEWEIFQLRRKRRVTREDRAERELLMGALPDFVVIGVAKCGTTFFYDLLTQHPLVEPAAAKELHFFDLLFEEGVEWYRRCFPQPEWRDGRRTITGEATPMLAHRLAPERMAEVAPQTQLIVLLRNPIDRSYSLYQHWARRGVEPRTFEEAIQAEETRLPETSEREHRAEIADPPFGYLSRSIYVDQLLRWREHFPIEQMLVLKSEDFFKNPQQTLKSALTFPDLPADRIPEVLKSGKKRRYGQEMDPSTRSRLEEYFAPHNRRLYDLLGMDFGW